MRTVWCGRRVNSDCSLVKWAFVVPRLMGEEQRQREKGKSSTVKKAAQATPNRQLRQERELHCWSQLEVADQIGTTPLNVSRWERGITSPNPHFRQELCTLFGKSPEKLGLLQDETPLIAMSPFLPIYRLTRCGLSLSSNSAHSGRTQARDPPLCRCYGNSRRWARHLA